MACSAQLGTDCGLGGVEASVCLCGARRRRDAELKIEIMLLTVNKTGCDVTQATGTVLIFTCYSSKLLVSGEKKKKSNV